MTHDTQLVKFEKGEESDQNISIDINQFYYMFAKKNCNYTDLFEVLLLLLGASKTRYSEKLLR